METENDIYFYGHKNEFGYMSNFYESSFIEYNTKFTCSEQYLMYYKCIVFDPLNDKLLNLIMKETSPGKIKKLGRQVKNYNDIIWDELRYNIMINGLRLKFNQNEMIKLKLKQTENKNLFEASVFDKIWGIGFNSVRAKSTNKERFGRNLLGQALMQVRQEIINKDNNLPSI
jgi:ribA/ribD-fused uncharacterized protein